MMIAKTRFFLIMVILLLVFTTSSLIHSESYPSRTKTNFQTQDKDEKLYTAKRNETLWHIAERRDIYNNPFAWPVIYKANRDQIKNPDMKLDGFTLKIPQLTAEEKEKYDKIKRNYKKVPSDISQKHYRK